MDLDPELTAAEAESPVASLAEPVEAEQVDPPQEPDIAAREPLLDSPMVELWRPVARRESAPELSSVEGDAWTELDLPNFEPEIEALESRIRRAVRTAASQAVEQALSRLLDGY